jgi:hypothetical protein
MIDAGDMDDAELLAARFHLAYEALALKHKYTTRPASAVPWEDVPTENKALMIDTARTILGMGYLPPPR